MEVKNNLTILLVFISINVFAQKKDFSILGKWQEISNSMDNGGGEMYTKKIKDGTILVFETNNIAKDNLGNKGKYELKGNRLKIELNKDTSYYFISYNTNTLDTLSLSPVTSSYVSICDEACFSNYIRRKYKK